jgi:hypothetical protein
MLRVRMNGLAGFTNAFLLLYALDGGLSLLEEALRAGTGASFLLGPRNLVALPVLLASVAGLPLLALTPKLPVRLLLPLFLSAIWLNYGAAPLPLLLAPVPLGLVAAAIQCALTALAFRFIRHHNVRRGEDAIWWLGDPEVPTFSASHTLAVSALGFFVLVPLAAAYGVLLFGTVVQIGTHEFIAFDRQGIQLADRRYVRDDQEIRLVGMMHVGEEHAYRELVRSFSVPATVVLEEGVRDESQLMPEPLAYDGVASVLGLDSQRELSSYVPREEGRPPPEWPVWRNADVDLAQFAPETLAWLDRVRELWASEDALEALAEIVRTSSEDPAVLEAIERDVFSHRNEHLLQQIEEALLEFERVVVPWGALHMPEIEAAVLEDGFALERSERRRLVSWGTVAAALSARRPAPEATPDAPARRDAP